MNKKLLKVDKNGTKYWGCVDTCFKCGGTGYIEQYDFYAGGVCFECNGRGLVQWEEKEYTPEYEAKLEARRAKREAAKLEQAKAEAEKVNLEFFESNGFNAEGKTFFVLGNTYSIKDELKAQGARWDNFSRHWHMATKPEGREVIEISVEEMYDADYAGRYCWKNQRFVEGGYTDKITAAEKNMTAAESTSQHVGNIGDKVELRLTYVHTASWENDFGGYWSCNMTYIHTLKDEQGNVFTWKTGNIIDADLGSVITLKGTIKEHSEYKGTKQTVLTRCKVVE